MPEVTIYTSSLCWFCRRARQLLESKGVPFTEISVDGEPERREEMMARSQRSSVPQIFIGDLHVGGSDDLQALEVDNRLDALLGLA